MLIDGRALSKEIHASLATKIAQVPKKLSLTVFAISPDAATRQFTAIKTRVGESIGVAVRVVELPETTSTDNLVTAIQNAALHSDGLIVQLPLPAHIDTNQVLASILPSHDVDGIGASPVVLPPVVAAFSRIVEKHRIQLSGAKAVVIGRGRLVGAPAARWLSAEGALVTVCDASTGDISSQTKNADIIILGAGSPGLLQPDMVTEGVVIFDAGTSEANGKVVGDADPRCAEKASFMTPVPGGVGPVAVSMIFENLLSLYERAN